MASSLVLGSTLLPTTELECHNLRAEGDGYTAGQKIQVKVRVMDISKPELMHQLLASNMDSQWLLPTSPTFSQVTVIS